MMHEPATLLDLAGRPGLGQATAALAAPGPGHFGGFFAEGSSGPCHLDVLFHRPARFGRASPILFVMHGTKRNAAEYRDSWATVAERYGCLVVCPMFPQHDFPRGAYQRGGVVDETGALRPVAAWALSAVERLFDLVRAATGNASAGYHLYGHSAGAQFVHRLVLLLPEARYVAAIAANAGWYTMPRFDEAYPYGLAGTGRGSADLRRVLGRRLTVLLGERDTDPEDAHLRNSRRARRQGRNRLERGTAFYTEARAAAASFGTALGWDLVTVPEAAHFDPDMMPQAGRILFDRG